MVADVLLSADICFTALPAADQAAHIAALLPALSAGTVEIVASLHLASEKCIASPFAACVHQGVYVLHPLCAQQPSFLYETP